VRDADFHLYAVTPAFPGTEDAVDREIAGLISALSPFSAGGGCFNFLGVTDVEGDCVERAFDPQAYARLVELKSSWDPQNLFRLTHNIRPAVPA
ncbi:MAG: FAD-binding oxidoreductase, partial [Dehalococcoidia bacterium]|nr:FAD-binding oxidoreductase [Dehalococcoidia bacterium]